jgi:hypothetical protein
LLSCYLLDTLCFIYSCRVLFYPSPLLAQPLPQTGKTNAKHEY